MLRLNFAFSLLILLLIAGCAPFTGPLTGAGTKPTPIVLTTPAGTVNPNIFVDPHAFRSALLNSLTARDAASLQSMMADPFTMAYWLSEGVDVAKTEAANQIISNYTAPGILPAFDSNKNLTGLFPDGVPGMPVPATETVVPVFVSGWGPEGKDEAIIYIARRADDSHYWKGILIARDGFLQVSATSTPSSSLPVLNTDVKYILAKANVNLRAGPGSTNNVIGTVFAGQISKVTGISADSKWWRVICPDDTIGSCWVSSDKGLTEPTSVPHENYPTPAPVVNTDVQYVMALKDVTIYDGPGSEYVRLGSVMSGQIAKVTGKSADSKWWRVICPNDTVGSCWISSDSGLTEPTGVPHENYPTPSK